MDVSKSGKLIRSRSILKVIYFQIQGMFFYIKSKKEKVIILEKKNFSDTERFKSN